MELVLTYSGRLPSAGNNSRAANPAKNEIRRALHPQLLEYCKHSHEQHFWLIPTAAGGLRLGGMRFQALAMEGLRVDLRIRMLRRDLPGRILESGDLDGRLKTLFDGLRMPKSEDELHGFILTDDNDVDRCICLMEDDSLVSALSIETARLLRPLRPGEKENDVEIQIDAQIRRA